MIFWIFLDTINISYFWKKENCICYNFKFYFEKLYLMLLRCLTKFRFVFLSLEDSIFWMFSKFVEYRSFHAKSPRLTCKNAYISLLIFHNLSPRAHFPCKYMLLQGICKKNWKHYYLTQILLVLSEKNLKSRLTLNTLCIYKLFWWI